MSTTAKSRHIVVCVTNFYPHPGGLERYAEELFSRLAQTGWKVTVIAYADKEEEEMYRGLRIMRIPLRLRVGGVVALPHMDAWQRVTDKLAAEGVDVISTQTRFFFSSWFGMKWAKKLKVPHVHTEHGSDFVQHASAVIRWGSWLVDVTMGKSILKNATAITGVSQDVATFVTKLSGRTAEVIHNGVDVTFWDSKLVKPLPTDLTKWIGKRQGLLFMGRIMGAKGWRKLIQAVNTLPNKADLAVIFAGTGPEESELKQEADKQPDIFRYIGSVDRSVVRDMLAVCAYANPSYSAEGLQTTLLEASAMNSWVITTDVSGTGEAIPAEVGVVVPRKDTPAFAAALTFLLDTKPVANGRSYMEKEFSWEHSLAQYRAVLDNVTTPHV